MAIKSEALMRLENVGIFYQDRKTGAWYNNFTTQVDLTPYLYQAGMFEH